MADPVSNISFDVVIAHGPGCNDGATSAWAVWRNLPQDYRNALAQEGGFYAAPKSKDDESETAESSGEPYIHPNSPEGAMRLQDRNFPLVFVFVQPSEGVPEKLVAGKNVLILDLDMGDALPPVVSAARFVQLVDHHDSTPLTLQKHANFLFGENRHKFSVLVNTQKTECGATLTWRLFNSAEIPPFVQVVRIGDTWQWNDFLELQAKFVLKALYVRRTFRSFEDIEDTFVHWSENFESYAKQGASLLDYENALVKSVAKQCDLGYIQTNDGTVYNVAYVPANCLHSEVGSNMKWYAEKRFGIPIHFCATWKYISYKSIVSVSLRDPNPGINLAVVCRNVKGTDGRGGGHAAAAGFSFYGIENFHNFILKSVPIPSEVNGFTVISPDKN